MFTPSVSLRRLLSIGTAIGLALPAQAQTVATPPGRVGQIANVSGNVSYDGAGSNGQWVAATANYPITSGDSLFTQAGAQAAIAVGSSELSLAPNTELQVTALDDTNFAATQSQGEIFLNLTDLQPGQSTTINTPRGEVSITQNGQYDIAAGDANDPTTVAVLQGAATIGQLQIPAGQEGFLSGTDQTTAQLGPIQHDAFMDQMTRELAPPPPPYAPPVVQQMTGAAELSSYGSWDQSSQYGAVWYPTVDSGWAPYREGHWAYVAPWGWTWVDVEPWGFAPFHYGRWIQDGSRWGWVPAGAYDGGGGGYQPVYAPAVVGFFGIGVGVAITAALLSHGSVGWVPLGPGEAYYPSYHSDPAYLQRINRVDVRDYQHITINNYNNTVINNYANHRAATYIPADAMSRGEQVGHYGHPMTDAMYAQAHPVHGQDFNQAVRPNYTPRAAQAPRPTDFAQRHTIPTPVISHAPMQPMPGHGQNMSIPGHGQSMPMPGHGQSMPLPGHEQNVPGGNGGFAHTEMQNHPEGAPAQPGFHPENAPNPPEHLPQQGNENHVQQPFNQEHAPQQMNHVPEQTTHMPLPQVNRPQEQQQFHAQAPMPNVIHPPAAPQQQFHAQEPQQQFHPEAAPQEFHPQPQMQHVQAPRPEVPQQQHEEMQPNKQHP